jgi:hypothetical protein
MPRKKQTKTLEQRREQTRAAREARFGKSKPKGVGVPPVNKRGRSVKYSPDERKERHKQASKRSYQKRKKECDFAKRFMFEELGR